MSSECKDCEDHFCCIYLGQRTCPKHCLRQNCFCARCQLYHIEVISPAVYSQRCDFLSECYNFKHIGRIANRYSYILERFCQEHCPTPDCPHREETTVDIPIPVPTIPDYGKVLEHVDLKEKIDLYKQGAVSSELENRETPIPGPAGNSSMGSELSEPPGGSPQRIPSADEPRSTTRSRRRTRGSGNARSEHRLSAKSIVGTRAASDACYTSMQRRKRNPRR